MVQNEVYHVLSKIIEYNFLIFYMKLKLSSMILGKKSRDVRPRGAQFFFSDISEKFTTAFLGPQNELSFKKRRCAKFFRFFYMKS